MAPSTIDLVHITGVVRRRFVALLFAVLALSACGEGFQEAEPEVSEADTGELTPVLPADDVTTTSEAAATSEESEATSTAPETTASPTTSTTATTTTTSTTTTTEVLPIPSDPLDQVALELELVARLSSPVDLSPRPNSDDLFVVEQGGRIVRLPDGLPESADTTLDLRGSVTSGNEQGLLGMEFSPDGERLYVNFTDGNGNTNLARYEMVGTAADPASVEVLLQIEQPRGNHNGGGIAFGPDGYLYIGMGDGGGGGDPFEHGQNTNTRHGAVLRIDVDTEDGYLIPPDNPFLDGDAPEVFVWGIRNAWRVAFDSDTDDLWIADVGQDRFEEVTVLRAAAGGGNGANLGWNQTEGAETYRSGVIPDDHVAPILTYSHGNRCSITGGEVYRGSAIPELFGTYFYGDFCTGEMFGYRVDESGPPTKLNIADVGQLTSFGLDNDGAIYALSRGGAIYRITG